MHSAYLDHPCWGKCQACSTSLITAGLPTVQVSAPEVEGLLTGDADEAGQSSTVSARQWRSSLHVQVCCFLLAVCMLEAVSLHSLIAVIEQQLCLL